jgi:hypothetical protein
LSVATISGGRNVIKRESEKIPKCKGLTIETGLTRNVKTKVKPVITETTGNISISFIKYLSNITVKNDNKYRGADKSSARPGRKQSTATDDFDFHISYL